MRAHEVFSPAGATIAQHFMQTGFGAHHAEYTMQITGETALQYLLYNTSTPNAFLYNMTQGTNSAYTALYEDNESAAVQGATLLVTYNYTVPPGCIISVNTTTANFSSSGSGNLTPNITSDNVTIAVNNTGNFAATITIKGVDFAGPATLGVNNTTFAGGDNFNFQALTNNEQTHKTNQGGGGAGFDSYLRVAIPGAQAAGRYNQNITYTMSC